MVYVYIDVLIYVYILRRTIYVSRIAYYISYIDFIAQFTFIYKQTY
nr:MAG TPA: hypothetical protein [Caudoviricetes sp.]